MPGLVNVCFSFFAFFGFIFVLFCFSDLFAGKCASGRLCCRMRREGRPGFGELSAGLGSYGMVMIDFNCIPRCRSDL